MDKNRIRPPIVWTGTMRAIAAHSINRGEIELPEPRTTVEGRILAMGRTELDRAYRLAGLLLGDADEAEDATQEALVRAWHAAGSLRDPDRFAAWFDRILVNHCRDRLRRRGTVRFVPLGEHGMAIRTRDPFQVVHDRDEVLRRMRGLDPDQRAVVVLHYWAGLSLDDVAERVGWPVGTVKSRLHRALESMRRDGTRPVKSTEGDR
jgi:RNA polymerase sigma-70 factor (ECF subfamily)